MKVLVCGDRNWSSREVIKIALQDINANSIIEGECRGADLISKDIAIELGIKVYGVKAEWNIYGRSAGPIRNKCMLDLSPDMVIAFHNYLHMSKGTTNMIKQSLKYEIPIRLYKSDCTYKSIVNKEELNNIITNDRR